MRDARKFLNISVCPNSLNNFVFLGLEPETQGQTRTARQLQQTTGEYVVIVCKKTQLLSLGIYIITGAKEFEEHADYVGTNVETLGAFLNLYFSYIITHADF